MYLARISDERKAVNEHQPIDAKEMAEILNDLGLLVNKFSKLMNESLLPLRPPQEKR